MTDSWMWKLARRLWPELAQFDEPRRTFSFVSMVILFITTPTTILALVWLIAETKIDTITDNALLLGVLTVAIVIMARQQFTIYIELETGTLIPATGSIYEVALDSAALIFGPSILWILVIESLISSVRNYRAARRANMRGLWVSLGLFTQNIGISLLASLAGLAVFRALGGTYPLNGLAPANWLPAAGGIAVIFVVVLVLQAWLISNLDRVLSTIGQQASLFGAIISISLLTIPATPFPILGALIYTHGSVGLFLFFVAGVLLVNYLAHYLSRTVDRSQQRTRELAQLEALSEAIIQAPPGLSTLQDLLTEHLGRMFPLDRVAVRLYESEDGAFAPISFRTASPENLPPVEDETWEQLHQSDETTITQSHVAIPDVTNTYGSAVAVLIATEHPGDEDAPDRPLGVVYLLRSRPQGRASASLPALQALASQIGSVFYRAEAHRETLASQKMAQELAFAGQVQTRFLPTAIPQLAGWDIAAGLTPARQTSGDFYDFVEFPDGRLGLLVADVADKGVGAALYMALSRTLIRTHALLHPDNPEQALELANERLLSDAQSDQFVTVFYGVLDPQNGTLVYANAGHNPPYVLSDGDTLTLPRTGPPLGMLEGLSWGQQTVTLPPGSTTLLYTDGVSEAQDADHAEFGEVRMVETTHTQPNASAATLHAAITTAIQQFVGDAPQFDDITLMVVCRV